MKLRLTAPGFEKYTGQMGVLFFEDGLSTGDVLHRDAVRLANVIGAEWEDGTQANTGQLYLDNMETSAPVEVSRMVVDAPVEEAAPVEDAPAANLYTEADLAAIADKSGIAGLRDIAEPLGIKGNSIGGLIAAILKAAAPKAE